MLTGLAALVSVGLVVGLVLGGVAPRLTVEERDEEIAALERQLESADFFRCPNGLVV